MVSIICPIFNEEKHIANCIDSLLKQDFPQENLEVLFVDGMSTDRTREIVREYSERHQNIRLIDNPQRTVPFAMNTGIGMATGTVIIRIDAHAAYAPNYVSTLVKTLEETGCDNVGAPCQTDVAVKTDKTLAIRQVLCHRFGVGNASFRIGIDKVKEVDTVPFGCWKKTVFDKYGLYDTRLTRNQDIELNKRIANGGGRILITPHTHSTYFARETFSALARNNYQNGLWNVLTVFYTRQFKSLSLRHFIPLAFLLSLIVPVLLSFVCPWALLIAGISLAAYLSLIVSISWSLSRKGLSFVNLVKAFITLHLSYGWGSMVGLFRILTHKV
ncbi:MAG: glycosyltransferase family 2 protein [Prevotella sp.]